VLRHQAAASLIWACKRHRFPPEQVTENWKEPTACWKGRPQITTRARRAQTRKQAPTQSLPQSQEADGTPSDLLKLISHELKTPLTVVQGQFQLVERQLEQLLTKELLPLLAGQPDLEKKVQAVSQNLHRGVQHSKRLTRLINDVLDLAHIQQGQWSLTLEHCNLVTLLRETIEDLQQLWPNRKLLLSLPATEQVPIFADEVRIRQVISNYVSNAHKYSPANQPIEVALHLRSEQVRVFVRDHGPGLSTEAQAQIWRRFYRAPGIEVQQGLETGLGLGLTICRQLVEQHEGQVGVYSAPGKGSIFWFTLPLVRPAE
jgi:signal transduction histidine kinase